ncbi:MAG: type II secretion system protein M [Gammaproteobacteria bacterium]|nr:type II secretion system protein M [Gammaproteobacteria bacterium]
MNEWWDSLAERERFLVSAMGGLMIIAMIYFLLIEPLFSGAREYRAKVAKAEQDLAWMKKMAPRLGQQSNTRAIPPGGDTLIAIVDRTTNQYQLKTSGNQTVGSDQLRVQFEQSSFNQLVTWFGDLHKQYNVMVASANFTHNDDDQPGVAKATVTVQKAVP